MNNCIFTNIMVATDGSELARKAVDSAIKEPVILEGNPANEIVNFAEKNEIELIVIGTLGKAGVQRFLLGSVAENVIRYSKVPVLMVRG
jgi:nucleotide-binding universal stress UspA family protein